IAEQMGFSVIPVSVVPSAGGVFDQEPSLTSTMTMLARPAFPASDQRLSKPRLKLCCDNQRRFLADGKDSAQILLFLDDPLPADLQVRLFSSNGKLTPDLMVIPRGQLTGDARLTADRPGVVAVTVQSSIPKIEVNNEKLKLSFAPPISKLDLKTSPPK